MDIVLHNGMHLNNSLEFWFSPAHSGVRAHLDSYCEGTLSMQLRGDKQWHVAFMPDIRASFSKYFEGDAGIYDSQHTFQADFVFNVSQGNAVIFGPGMVHSTVVGGESE